MGAGACTNCARYRKRRPGGTVLVPRLLCGTRSTYANLARCSEKPLSPRVPRRRQLHLRAPAAAATGQAPHMGDELGLHFPDDADQCIQPCAVGGRLRARGQRGARARRRARSSSWAWLIPGQQAAMNAAPDGGRLSGAQPAASARATSSRRSAIRDNFLVGSRRSGARRLHIQTETAPRRNAPARPQGRMSRFSPHRGENPAAAARAPLLASPPDVLESEATNVCEHLQA